MARLNLLVLKVVRFLRRFFPLVLLIHHTKHNLLGVFYWLLFYLLVANKIGVGFGLSYLFLSPEYQGEPSFIAFLMLGFSFGGLTMAFHSYSYMRLASRFPFLAMVNKPFVRFSINNSIIPLSFLVFYLLKLIDFQLHEELQSGGRVMLYILGVILGFNLFVGISLLYFFPINKNLFELKRFKDLQQTRNERWVKFGVGRRIKIKSGNKQQLYWYIGKGFRIVQCRSTRHYAQSLLQSVFDQNRISTTLFEITTITTFILIGLFGGREFLDVPAGVSVILLLTILMMLLSAWMAWLRYWAYPLLIILFLVMNYMSQNWEIFRFQTQAYGLSYDSLKPYNDSVLDRMSEDDVQRTNDLNAYIAYLNNWKKKTGLSKPKLVIVNTSGGGSRSASWVFEVLRTCDSMTSGQFSNHIAMVTGASGGTVGAAYFRSLLLDRFRDSDVDINNPKYFHQISEDLLNKLAFAASTNDMFFRYQSSFDFGSTYSFDRGMAFENDLNENTEDRLNKNLGFYKDFEDIGAIPNLILSPSVVNDGRRILISSQGLSFLTTMSAPSPSMNSIQEMVDLNALLGKDAENLRLSSALRMNATFPFVLPMTSLPTKPEIQVMDAGSRDNFGTKVTVQWLMALENWIVNNTSGVIILQIRDNRKIMYEETTRDISFLDKFSAPITNVISNFPRIQDYDQDQLWETVIPKYGVPLTCVSVNLRQVTQDKISLSWHLTQNEKNKIKRAIKFPANSFAILKLLRSIK